MENPYLQKFGFLPPQLTSKPDKDTGLFVVIPSYDESALIDALKSINDCIKPSSNVEVITVINASAHSDKEVKLRNVETLRQAKIWAENHSKDGFYFHFIEQQNLPKKHAGVGLARKIGMDEVIYRIEHISCEDPPIICFDADSKCDSNYLLEIEKGFKNHPEAKGAAIYFEHPISGEQFNPEVYSSITDYELHLRYYKNALAFTGHPQACYTIGSSMAVLASAYQSQGGMNKRKAGEDFYFMQKIIERFPVIEINTTRVIPSPRPSHRVPFGTGRAVSEFLGGKDSNESYSFSSFKDLKILIDNLETIYTSNELDILSTHHSLPLSIRSFFVDQNFEERLSDLIEYGTTWNSFRKRFYNWFNAFRALKFIHFCRDNYYPNVRLDNAVLSLLSELKLPIEQETSNQNLLIQMRLIDKSAK